MAQSNQLNAASEIYITSDAWSERFLMSLFFILSSQRFAAICLSIRRIKQLHKSS